MHVIAGKAAAFHEALQTEFHAYSRSVVANAQALAKVLVEGGLRVVTGGTDCHLVLVDLQPFGLTGKDAAEALEGFDITANKNAVPFDTLPPTITSGLRLGSPAATSRGFDEAAFRETGAIILDILEGVRSGKTESAAITRRVKALTSAFPITEPSLA